MVRPVARHRPGCWPPQPLSRSPAHQRPLSPVRGQRPLVRADGRRGEGGVLEAKVTSTREAGSSEYDSPTLAVTFDSAAVKTATSPSTDGSRPQRTGSARP